MKMVQAIGHAAEIAGTKTWQTIWALVLGSELSSSIEGAIVRNRSHRYTPTTSDDYSAT